MGRVELIFSNAEMFPVGTINTVPKGQLSIRDYGFVSIETEIKIAGHDRTSLNHYLGKWNYIN